MGKNDYCGVIIDGRLVSFREPRGFNGNVVIADGVTEICNRAFEVAYCGIKTVIIPSTVTKIGERAFACCEHLREITIPEGVEYIGEGAFSDCHSLKKVKIASTVTTIGAGAFDDCGNIEEITVDENNPVYSSAGNCLIDRKKKILLRGCKNSVIPSDGSVTVIGERSFSNNTAHPRNSVHSKGISEIVIPDGVTKIGKYAFDFNYALESVEIPDSVKNIEKRAFSHCFNLKNVKIGNGVRSIGDSAFEYDENLKIDLSFPKSLTKIGTYAFYYSGIKSLTIGGDLNTIGKNAFRSCKNLKSVTFVEGVTEISELMFGDCEALETVTFAQSVKSVGKCAFLCCERLKNVFFNDGLETISEDAFHACSMLESIEIPESVKYIGKGAFAYCEKLGAVKMPASVEFMGSGVFTGCPVKAAAPKKTGAVGFDIANNELIKYKGKSADVIIPEGVTKIAAKAFFNKKNVESITLPASLISIANRAIEKCSVLKRINVANGNPAYRSVGNCLIDIKKKTIVYGFKNSEIPVDGSVTAIAANAFAGTDLESIVIPEGVKTIGSCAFKSCAALKSVSMPQSVKTIGSSAFKYCTALTSITVPKSAVKIGNDAFSECTSLTEICFNADACDDLWVNSNLFDNAGKNTDGVTFKVGANVQKIPSYLFVNSRTDIISNITRVEFAENSVCKVIGDDAFESCKKIIEIKLPDTVTAIGRDAFNMCSALKTVNIPKGVTAIGAYAFCNCTSLTEIFIPAGVTKLIGVFEGCGGLESITVDENNRVFHSDGNCLIDTKQKILVRGSNNSVIPSDGSVVRIDNNSFDNCSKLESIVIPDGVEEIFSNVFTNCTKLKSVTIAATVTYVSTPFFKDCTSLVSIAASRKLLQKYDYFGLRDKEFGPNCRRVSFSII